VTAAREFRHLRECYGCSSENAASLGIVNVATAEGAEARVRFGREHQGPPGLVHGGLLATLLDEAMGTVPCGMPGIRLTAEMSVRYRQPTPIDTDLVCRARIADASDRGFTVDATIVAADDEIHVLVAGSATYVLSTGPGQARPGSSGET
jgi:acyl-coenzyme A thioesterase PaaI-like protein